MTQNQTPQVPDLMELIRAQIEDVFIAKTKFAGATSQTLADFLTDADEFGRITEVDKLRTYFGKLGGTLVDYTANIFKDGKALSFTDDLKGAINEYFENPEVYLTKEKAGEAREIETVLQIMSMATGLDILQLRKQADQMEELNLDLVEGHLQQARQNSVEYLVGTSAAPIKNAAGKDPDALGRYKDALQAVDPERRLGIIASPDDLGSAYTRLFRDNMSYDKLKAQA
jgi:hypothetical protein